MAMPATATEPRTVSFQSAIDEALRYALEHGASVEFSCREKSYGGQLVQLDQHLLTIRLELDGNDSVKIENENECTLTVFCGLGMIAFASKVHKIADACDTVVVQIDGAESLRAPQRRRFWRSSCQESTRVLLTPGDQAPFEAALLNISADGLACLADSSSVPNDAHGSRWYLSFRLANQFSSISISAILRSSSPGSDSDHTILRFQFDFSDDTSCTREQIQTAISVSK